MATVQEVFNRTEILFPEMQLASGESGVTRGLTALNMAQDALESVLASLPNVLGSSTTDVTTAADTEATAFPSGLLRIDKLHYIDPSTSRPSWQLVRHPRVGHHAFHGMWPWNLIATQTSGKPRAYWTNGTNIYWDPLPSGTHTVRIYGFIAATDYTAATDTFAYPDIVLTPMASLMVKLLRTGLDDDVGDITDLASEIFEPVIKTLSNANRDGAARLVYQHFHTT